MASHSVAFIPGDESVIVIGDGELSILRRRLQAALKRLEELKFVTKVDSEEEAWEVRRILKARFPIEDIEALRERLQAFEQERS